MSYVSRRQRRAEAFLWGAMTGASGTLVATLVAIGVWGTI